MAEIATYTRNSDANPFDRRWADDRDDTHGVVMMSMKKTPTPCGDCGKVCPGGPERVHRKVEDFWIKRCVTCSRYFNPITGKYDLRSQTNVSVIKDYWKKARTNK